MDTKYVAILSDNYEVRMIRITGEQKKFLDWLDKYRYLEGWRDEYEGEITLQEEKFEIEDLTI